MVVHEIANNLDSAPSQRSRSERLPGKVKEFAVHFAITARYNEIQSLDRHLLYIQLGGAGSKGVWLSTVSYDRVVQKTYNAGRRIDAPAMISKSVKILLHGQRRLCPEIFGSEEVSCPRRVNAQHEDDRCWEREIQSNVVADFD